jgi:hypothetical protein
VVAGLPRASGARARAAARGLLAQVGLEEVADDAERRVGRLTEEIVSASRANRDLLEQLIAGEVTKAASRWGFVRSDDLDEVREEIAELRAQLARQQGGSATAAKKPARKTAGMPKPAAAARTAAAGRTSASAKPATPAKTATPRTATPAKTPGGRRAGTTSSRPGAAQKLATRQAAAAEAEPQGSPAAAEPEAGS